MAVDIFSVAPFAVFIQNNAFALPLKLLNLFAQMDVYALY